MEQLVKTLPTSSEINKKPRSGAIVNAYLIIRKEENVLLLLRKNTGYCDGQYSIIAGHVEDGEPATSGIIRETFEEADIQIHPENLKVVHVMHRKSDRPNIDIFFEYLLPVEKFINKEPEKCEVMEYFPIDQLPSNMSKYVKYALNAISIGETYSEHDWE